MRSYFFESYSYIHQCLGCPKKPYITKTEGFEGLKRSKSSIYSVVLYEIYPPLLPFELLKKKDDILNGSSLLQLDLEIRKKILLTCFIMPLRPHDYAVFAEILIKIWPSAKS